MLFLYALGHNERFTVTYKIVMNCFVGSWRNLVEMLLAIGTWLLTNSQQPPIANSQRPTTFPLNPFMSRFVK